MSTQNNGFEIIGHFYQPIEHYNGLVLKYQGMACKNNIDFMMEKNGMIILDSYKGDRITHDTFLSIA